MCGAGDQLAETIARQRRNFGERLVRDQRRRELPRDRHRDFDRLAFEPRLDRLQRVVRLGEAGGDAFQRRGHAALGFDLASACASA